MTAVAWRFDAATLEILWSRLIAIAEEQSAIVIRTAFSNIVRESYDYTCVLLTPEGDLLAQPFQSLPGFTRCCSTVTKHFIARWRYWHPDEFAALESAAYELGFDHVAAGPLVRSSYHADQHVPQPRAGVGPLAAASA